VSAAVEVESSIPIRNLGTDSFGGSRDASTLNKSAIFSMSKVSNLLKRRAGCSETTQVRHRARN
jgi:hypothetical protein